MATNKDNDMNYANGDASVKPEVVPTPQPLLPDNVVQMDRERLKRTLNLVANMTKTAAKFTKDFTLDDRLADVLLDLANEEWVLDLIQMLFDNPAQAVELKAMLTKVGK